MSRRTLQIWHIFCHTVRYIYNNHIDENLLFCQPLYGRTKGMDIFQEVDDFFAKVRLVWTDCVSVCTDGTAVMTRHAAGLCTRVRSATDTPITFTHCMIHREALVAKIISSNLNTVVQDAEKVINFRVAHSIPYFRKFM